MRLSPLILFLVAVLPLLARGADADPYKTVDERTLKEARLGTDGATLVDYFRGRVPAEAVKDSAETLIKQLGDDDYLVREKATAALVALGVPAAPLLRLAAKESPNGDYEVIRRAEKILAAIDRVAGPAVSLAAARTIARRNPDGACAVLLDYLPYADDDAVAEEVRKALSVVGFRDGQPSKTLTEALEADDVRVRAAAAFALVRGGDAEQRKGLKKLLEDSEPLVRLRAGLAFFERKDSDSLPALIDTLDELPTERLWAVEDLLNLVAGDKAPAVPLGNDAASRQKCHDAWAAWWKQEGAAIDLAKLDLSGRLKGLTLIASYGPAINNGQLYEIGPDGGKRWQINGLQYPLDAEVIGEDLVAVAEYRRKRVAVLDFKGTVKWEKTLATYPIGVQGLPDGHTLIATRNQVIEVDDNGNDVRTINPPAGGLLTGARKLPDGGFALLATTGTITLLDKGGRQQKSFRVGNISTSIGGTRFDITPAGRILVAHYAANKVAEYDRDGKEVWQATVRAPASVMRLPNGRTLVSSTVTQRVVELDRGGREVWEYKADRRIMSVRKR